MQTSIPATFSNIDDTATYENKYNFSLFLLCPAPSSYFRSGMKEKSDEKVVSLKSFEAVHLIASDHNQAISKLFAVYVWLHPPN